ncbi:hypothetical protein KSP40_PGU019066 [Platanthera guangdongensis]|uniref:Tubulin-specific chaperone D C-terminal domain-containing protein n=1 Tax=Platanthera guangdongensis TaxID=2320717 RepID=A0ABR2MA51_9ASPA
MEHPSNSAKFLTRLDVEEEEDDEHDTKEGVLLRYFLQEWELVKSIIGRIVANAGATDPSDANKIRSIIDKYQEQGHLLEPFLESIVNPLMSIVQSKSMQLTANIDGILDIIRPICIIIYSLVTTCGYKSVIRFFPHQVSDLEIAVTLLEKCHNRNPLTSLRQESTGEMETQCVTLLWLYILVLIPFDISSVDTSITNCSQLGVCEPSPLVLKLLKISKEHLSSAGPMRRFSALVLSRLLTRPDMPMVFARSLTLTPLPGIRSPLLSICSSTVPRGISHATTPLAASALDDIAPCQLQRSIPASNNLPVPDPSSNTRFQRAFWIFDLIKGVTVDCLMKGNG